VLVVVGLLTSGCGAAPTPKSYVFRPDNSPIKVDTPALRAEKAAAGIANCPRSTIAAAARAHGLPAVTLPCLGGGRNVNLAGLTGTPTIVNFWSQSCGPCRDESPLLQKFQDAAGHKVRVVGVDWEDAQPGMAIEFAKQLGITYPQIADPDAATRAPLHVAGLPLSVFVDASGRVVRAKYGAITSMAELTDLVSGAFGVDVTGAS
jgi:thiol-disulfide isomerase/thioredoxin